MPELGKYEMTVLASYAITILLIVILVLWSLYGASRTKKQLAALEAKRRKNA